MDKEHYSRYTERIRPMGSAASRAIGYIRDRHAGKITSLKTDLKKLNESLLDGIEWNRILTIGAMSGSGKSVLCEQIKQSALRESNIPFECLSFEFEMPAQDQMIRAFSSRLNMSVQEMLLNKELSKEKWFYEELNKITNEISSKPFFYNEEIGTPEEIVTACKEFAEKRQLKEKGLGFLVTIDHVLLTKNKEGEDERRIIASLVRSLIDLKKYFVAEGIPVIFIMLSQLNRNIETPERVLNPDLHFPTRNDLFGSSDIFMGSDYVLIIHRPVILKLREYGPNSWPVVDEATGRSILYMHLIKQRFGDPVIFKCLDDFKNSKILNI